MSKKTLVFVLWLTLAVISNSGATTYYVSPTGDDTRDGKSLVNAWKTLTKANTIVVGGDTVTIADGSYAGGIKLTRGGNAILPVIYRATNPGNAIFTGDLNAVQDGLTITGASYVVIDGLSFTKFGRLGIRVDQSNHCTVRRCRLFANGIQGMLTDYSDDLLIEFNECHHNVAQHGIYVSNSGDRPIIRHNICYANGRSGIQVNADASLIRPELGTRGDGFTDNAVVDGNIIFDNGRDGAAGLNCASIRNSLIVNNLIYNNVAGGIALWDDGDGLEYGSTNNIIVNNTIYFRNNEGRRCLSFQNGSTGNLVLNNILYGGQHEAYEIDSYSSIIADYNVLFTSNGSGKVVSFDDFGYAQNLVDWSAASGNDLHSVYGDPWFANSTEAPFDFHVVTSSIAIGRGKARSDVREDIDGNPRAGSGFIMAGCYEFAVSITVPVAPTNLSALPSNNRLDLYWSPTARTSYYNVMRATKAAGPFSLQGVAFGPTYRDSSLLNNVPYYYKVQAVNPAGVGPFSAVISGIPQDLPTYSYFVRINPKVVSGSLPAVGSITVSDPAPAGGLTYYLSTSNAVLASTVPSITIPEGETFGTFPITTGFTNSWQSVTFTATSGINKRQYSMTVTMPNIQAISLSANSVVGGTPLTGTVDLDAVAGPKGRIISLFVDPQLTAPTSVKVLAGKSSITFAVPTKVVTEPVEAVIVGSDDRNYKGFVVNVLPMLNGISLDNSSVTGGLPITGTITLNGPAPSAGTLVTLTDNSAVATTPATVKVLAGQVSATFVISTLEVTANTNVIVTASFAGASSQATFSVKPNLLTLALSPTTVKGGIAATGTLTLTSPAPAGGYPVTLASNNAAATVPASVVIPEGATSATFTITTKVVTANVNVTINANGKTKVLTVTK